MRSLSRQNLIYMSLVLCLFIAGYIYLRYSFNVMDKAPFTQEVVLVVLSVIATVLITATLLNKQTEVELKKEQSIKFIQLKSEIYMDFIHYIEQLLLARSVTEDNQIQLQFFTHKLAIVASPPVLEQYEHFLQVFKQFTQDEDLDLRESQAISFALAQLTVKIRQDLIGELDSHWQGKFIAKQVINNAKESQY